MCEPAASCHQSHLAPGSGDQLECKADEGEGWDAEAEEEAEAKADLEQNSDSERSEEDDECREVAPPPRPPPHSHPHGDCSGDYCEDLGDDVVLVGASGGLLMRDLPHARADCPLRPFAAGSAKRTVDGNERACAQCCAK